MAAAAWKGFISFGLITIPVRLYAAARRSRFELHQLHRKCHTRLRQPLFCPTCNRPVDKSEVVKGFEYEEGKYALIEPEEIKKIEPQSARSMDVLAFAKSSEIDPLFFDSSYFLVPEEQGQKAYQLLLKALEDKNRVAIAKITMHQREYTAFIRPYDRGLALHTMYYANEVREAPGYGKTEGVKLSPKEVKLAEQLVENLSEEFHIQKYHDEFQERLHALIEAKRKGHETASESPQPRRAPVIDIMTALKKSLERAGGAQKSRVQAGEHSRKGSARRAS
ncbi:MAG: Ku protein [Candidatus Acidiferrales bacterium]